MVDIVYHLGLTYHCIKSDAMTSSLALKPWSPLFLSHSSFFSNRRSYVSFACVFVSFKLFCLGLHLIHLAFGISLAIHQLLLAFLRITRYVLFTVAYVRSGPNNMVDRIKPNRVNPCIGKRRVVVLDEIGVSLIRIIPNPC